MGMTSAERLTDDSTTPTPPLQAGDRLTRDEFERRYEAMPQLKKAELIEGVVYMSRPQSVITPEPNVSSRDSLPAVFH